MSASEEEQLSVDTPFTLERDSVGQVLRFKHRGDLGQCLGFTVEAGLSRRCKKTGRTPFCKPCGHAGKYWPLLPADYQAKLNEASAQPALCFGAQQKKHLDITYENVLGLLVYGQAHKAVKVSDQALSMGFQLASNEMAQYAEFEEKRKGRLTSSAEQVRRALALPMARSKSATPVARLVERFEKPDLVEEVASMRMEMSALRKELEALKKKVARDFEEELDDYVEDM